MEKIDFTKFHELKKEFSKNYIQENFNNLTYDDVTNAWLNSFKPYLKKRIQKNSIFFNIPDVLFLDEIENGRLYVKKVIKGRKQKKRFYVSDIESWANGEILIIN